MQDVYKRQGTGYSQPPLPICYQQIYSRNLAIDDIRDKQGNLLTSVSMLQIIPLLIDLYKRQFQRNATLAKARS